MPVFLPVLCDESGCLKLLCFLLCDVNFVCHISLLDMEEHTTDSCHHDVLIEI